MSDVEAPLNAAEDIGFIGADVTELPEYETKVVHVEPTGYHLLIEMPQRQEKTITGIYRPEEYRLKEQTASVTALVIEVGPEAFLDKDRFPTQRPWCVAGDHILIHPYTGSRFQIRNRADGKYTEYRIIEDRHVLAVVSKEMLNVLDRINAA